MAAPSPVPPAPSVRQPRLDSQIILKLPDIFADFRRKRFSILWRSNRDGFGASEFHRRCDGHANTLTVILDPEGNTLAASLRFLFTLKNPHDVALRKLALKADMMHLAIYCEEKRCAFVLSITVPRTPKAEFSLGQFTSTISEWRGKPFSGSCLSLVENMEASRSLTQRLVHTNLLTCVGLFDRR
jgi:hypothetical protein